MFELAGWRGRSGGATGIAAEATPVPSQSRGLSQGLGAPLPPANFASLEKNPKKINRWWISDGFPSLGLVGSGEEGDPTSGSTRSTTPPPPVARRPVVFVEKSPFFREVSIQSGTAMQYKRETRRERSVADDQSAITPDQGVPRLFSRGTLAGLGEGELLDRFVGLRDETAFAELIARHGPMVLSVCSALARGAPRHRGRVPVTFLILVARQAPSGTGIR